MKYSSVEDIQVGQKFMYRGIVGGRDMPDVAIAYECHCFPDELRNGLGIIHQDLGFCLRA